MEQQLYFVLGLGAPVVAALFSFFLIRRINSYSPGTEVMQRIAGLIRSGAMAFLKTEYTVLAGFVGVMFVILWLFLPQNSLMVGVSFLVGAVLSASAGWVGMRTATAAGVRTTFAATTKSVGRPAGGVLEWGGHGTHGRGSWDGWNRLVVPAVRRSVRERPHRDRTALRAFPWVRRPSLYFARVGGGIYTKAADVAGDLSGKVEAGIPEDDPRNPATIADSVGDNVGDVAGMGADLFESYVGSIIASIALAWALTAPTAAALWGVNEESFSQVQGSLVLFPILLSGAGILASILGTFAVNTDDESKVAGALHRGLLVASALVLVAAGGLIVMMGIPFEVLWCVILGLVAGVAIGQITEYYTGKDKPPAQHIAKQSETGPATNIIAGLGVGMMSTGLPIHCHLRCDFLQLCLRGAVRDSHRGGRHAVDTWHQSGGRRIRAGSRQRRRDCRDEQVRRVRAATD